MGYSEKLRDPRWQKKRLEIFGRDNWTCVSCGCKDKPLNVHHLTYRKCDPWEYPDELYQTLCEDCHGVRQELTDKIVEAIRISLKNIPTRRLTAVSNKLCEVAMLELPDGGDYA